MIHRDTIMTTPYPTTSELISSVRNKQVSSGKFMTRKDLSNIFTHLQKEIQSTRNVSDGSVFKNSNIVCTRSDREVPVKLRISRVA